MRRSDDFAETVRRGRRAGRGSVVLHYLAPPPDPAPPPTRVGFVVGKAVGGSARRHRVARQLRHLVRDRLDRLPAGARLVVRAQQNAYGRPSQDLGHDLDAALDRILR